MEHTTLNYEHYGTQSASDPTHYTLITVSDAHEIQNVRIGASYNSDAGFLPYPSVEPVVANQGHNPSDFNVENTWNDYGPTYPVCGLDDTGAWTL